MKVVRTFHPVGQGTFYSERFYEEDKPQAKYNIVFDCGTSWGTILKAKKVVTQAFDKNDKITVNLSLTLTARQLSYRYRNSGDFHRVMMKVCC